MTPFVKNINIRRGDTKEMFFRVRTKVWNAGTSTYDPGPYKDLTGYTITAQVRQTKSSVTPLLEFNITIGNQADEVDGRGAVLMKIPASQTASVPTSIPTGVYDVQFTEPDTDVFTYLEGAVTFDEDVTRA